MKTKIEKKEESDGHFVESDEQKKIFPVAVSMRDLHFFFCVCVVSPPSSNTCGQPMNIRREHHHLDLET